MPTLHLPGQELNELVDALPNPAAPQAHGSLPPTPTSASLPEAATSAQAASLPLYPMPVDSSSCSDHLTAPSSAVLPRQQEQPHHQTPTLFGSPQGVTAESVMTDGFWRPCGTMGSKQPASSLCGVQAGGYSFAAYISCVSATYTFRGTSAAVTVVATANLRLCSSCRTCRWVQIQAQQQQQQQQQHLRQHQVWQGQQRKEQLRQQQAKVQLPYPKCGLGDPCHCALVCIRKQMQQQQQQQTRQQQL